MTTVQGNQVQRPYSEGSFQSKLDKFELLMKEMTLQNVHASSEEKRQMITGK